MVVNDHHQPNRLVRRFHLLLCGCHSKAVDHVALQNAQRNKNGSPTKPRTMTVPTTLSDGRHTVSSSSGSDEHRVVEVPLRSIPPLPTREILQDDMPSVSFLTIEPVLMSIDPDGHYHDRRDCDDDDISEMTGFRDYSLISM